MLTFLSVFDQGVNGKQNNIKNNNTFRYDYSTEADSNHAAHEDSLPHKVNFKWLEVS